MKRRELVSRVAAASLALGSGCASFGTPTATSPPRQSYANDGNWPMARADHQNSGGIAANLDWESMAVERLLSEADTDGRRVSTLAFADGYLVAVVGDLTVVVWDVEKRTERWRRETDRAVTTTPAIANESVYVSTESKVLSFALESGERRWATEATSLDLPLLPTGNRLVVEDKPDSEIVGLDARSGDRTWSSPVEHSPRGVAVVNGQAFVTQRGEAVGVVTALTTRTGERQWRRELDPIDVLPTVAGETVLVATKTGTVHALRRTDGETVWTNRTTTAREGHYLPLARDEKAVYVPTNGGGDVRALSLTDGTELWRAETGHSDDAVVLTSDSVVLPRGDELEVYRKLDGTERQSVAVGGDVLSTCPTASGVFVAAETRVVHLR